MAVRKQRWHPEEVRQRIQASQLINRLYSHAVSESPIMEQSQVNAARILLNKVLPDLSQAEVKHDATGELAGLLAGLKPRVIEPGR